MSYIQYDETIEFRVTISLSIRARDSLRKNLDVLIIKKGLVEIQNCNLVQRITLAQDKYTLYITYEYISFGLIKLILIQIIRTCKI